MFILATVDIVWGIINMHRYILAEKPPDINDGDGDDDDDANAEDHKNKREMPIKVLQYKFLLYITSK